MIFVDVTYNYGLYNNTVRNVYDTYRSWKIETLKQSANCFRPFRIVPREVLLGTCENRHVRQMSSNGKVVKSLSVQLSNI